jgi:hypothetical protein
MDFCEGFGHSNNGFNVSDGNWDTSTLIRFSSDVSIELSDLVLVHFCKLWLHESLGVNQVFLEHLLRNDVWVWLVHDIVRKHVLFQVVFSLFLLNISLLFWDLLILLVVLYLSN